MEALSDAAVFLSLALLATVVTIFVLAASLLGRALQKAREEQQEASEREKEEAETQAAQFNKTITETQEKLKKADTSEAVSALEAQLSQYKKERRASEKRSRKAARRAGRYRVLTVSWGVLPTSMLLLSSLVLAAVAEPVAKASGYVLLSLSGSLLAYACYRIYQSLRVVQEVAITTEEAQFKREAEALGMALERHEERKRPKLELQFTEPKLPFRFKPSVEQRIIFEVRLKQGDVAKSTQLWFIAPAQFDFPGSTTSHRPATVFEFPDTLQTEIKLDDLKSGMYYRNALTIKPPSELGTYTLAYCLNCEGYSGKFETFEIEVAE